MFFGKKFKEFRLKYSKKGLRTFAFDNDINPSHLSEIERGLRPPSKSKKWFNKIVKAMNLPKDSNDYYELLNLWEAPFIMQEMDENMMVSPFVHKSDGTRLTTEEYINFNEHLKFIARKHNEKARKYNQKHGLSGKSKKTEKPNRGV